MATRKVKLTGIAQWAKVFESNRDLEGFEGSYKDHNGGCTINLILDDENMEKLRQSRSLKKGTPDPEGRGTSVKFLRKFEEQYGGGAPTVKHVDGRTWDEEVDGYIGNDSFVGVVLTVYDTSRKGIVGTRLDSVVVIDHVPYTGGEDDDFSSYTKPDKPEPTKNETFDDEIPF